MLVLLYRSNVCFDDQCMMLRENVPYDIQNCATSGDHTKGMKLCCMVMQSIMGR